jgi:ubiquitin-conjugating enzyme E2 Q
MAKSVNVSRRLMKDYKELVEAQTKNEFIYVINPDDIGNMSIINLYITRLTTEQDTPIEKQMIALKIPNLHMEIRVPENYPFSPPFVRFISPKFEFRTGHITLGGSICMELLTNQGWVATCTLENLLRQIILQIQLGGAAIDETVAKDFSYDLKGAKEAYERMKISHGWK